MPSAARTADATPIRSRGCASTSSAALLQIETASSGRQVYTRARMRTAHDRTCTGAGVLLAAMLAATARPAAHEIPPTSPCTRSSGRRVERLRLLVRVPLRAMRDMNFPTARPGLPRPRARRCGAAPGRAALDREQRRAARSGSAGSASGQICRGPRVAAFRPLVRLVRGGARARATARRCPIDDGHALEPGACSTCCFEYPIRSDRSDFAIQSRLRAAGSARRDRAPLRVPDGTVRAFEYAGDPGLVPLDPRWHQAAWTLRRARIPAHPRRRSIICCSCFCLVIPFRRVRPLILVVTSFTVAHSITLIASAAGFTPDALWFPPLVETLIAASIVYMALENIVGRCNRLAPALADGVRVRAGPRLRLLVRAAETLQFAGSHLLTSLLAFNVGVELGQLLVLAALVPALDLFFASSSPSGWGRSSCRRSSRTRAGTG